MNEGKVNPDITVSSSQGCETVFHTLAFTAVYLVFCLTVGKWLKDLEEHATATQKGPEPGLEPVAYY